MRFDLPSPDAETQPWWDAARDGRLLIKRCRSCGKAHFYPRPFCPRCWSDDVEWEDASGRATLYTFSIVRRNDLPPFGERVPYVAAAVDLEEGPRMLTNIVDCEHADLAVGMALEVTFRQETDEFTFPVFRPAGRN
jgi:hypothetical protein